MKRISQMVAAVLGFCAVLGELQAGPVRGWLDWRGPLQNGSSLETNLPDTVKVGGPDQLWTADFPGQSTAVIANGKLYIMGYLGDGPNLQEGVACFDAESGKKLWQHLFSDFLSDTIYLRYATSSPAIDPETGNVYIQGTQGILACFSAEGKMFWQHSLMEEIGRLTFPNGRTASPVIDQDLVITRAITANWGAQGPGADRFYAFDKKTGELVWASSPGDRPKDNSFSHPILSWLAGKRVFYSACGDGSVVCVNARTGDPLWRVPLFNHGINATVLVHHDDKVVAIFGTPYEKGGMVALNISHDTAPAGTPGPLVIDAEKARLWKNELSSSASSPILVGDRAYVCAETGELCAVDVNTGKVLWRLKLGIEQRNSCPLYADGKLYVPMLNEPGSDSAGEAAVGQGAFYIIQPGETEGKILCHVALDGRCFGSPAVYNGKVYMQTTKKLYCFGRKGDNSGVPAALPEVKMPAPGPKKQLQIIPSEVLMRPGQTNSFRAQVLDANGYTVEEVTDMKSLKWQSYIPPTAKVKATMKAAFSESGQLVAAPDPVPSAGAFEATLGDLKGYIRGRVLPYIPLSQDFEKFTLTETNAAENALFAYPPLPWIGARFKFEVRELDGNKVLTKTIDNTFFQRATVFIGHPDMKSYTIEADVMSDGNKRKMSEVGLVNQRYYIVLKGNEQSLEINSNLERLRQSVPFKWSVNQWYRLKTRVDVAADGSGVVRAKAWKKGDPEPAAWTLEVKHDDAHANGSPGLFGFSPQSMRVYIDNIEVKAND